MNTKLTGKEFKGMSGAFSAMFTPFDKKGRVNEEAIDALVEYGLKGGLKGFYLTGSTGEGMLLTNEDRICVYRRAVKAAKGRCFALADHEYHYVHRVELKKGVRVTITFKARTAEAEKEIQAREEVRLSDGRELPQHRCADAGRSAYRYGRARPQL